MKDVFIGSSVIILIILGCIFVADKVLDNSIYCDTIAPENEFKYVHINTDKPEQRQKCKLLPKSEMLEREAQYLREKN